MAIGWGKSFEEQVEEAHQRASEKKHGHRKGSERKREEKLETLRLSRSRIEQQLSNAVHAAHREMLMKALRAIELEAEEINRSTDE